MRVDQANLRKVVFDCPWAGHLVDNSFVVKNSAAPHVIGQRCVKCHALIYEFVELGRVVGPDGQPIEKAPKGEKP